MNKINRPKQKQSYQEESELEKLRRKSPEERRMRYQKRGFVRQEDDEANLKGLLEKQRKLNQTQDGEHKNKKAKKKKRKKLFGGKHKKGPVKRLTKSATRTAMFLGTFFIPIILFMFLLSSLLFLGAYIVHTHQINVISTLASPEYYAELGQRHLLGGSRKITDIPQDLIGMEPDLNIDYAQNDQMQSNSGKAPSTAIGSINDKDRQALISSIAYQVAKGTGTKHPDWIVGQMNQEHSVVSQPISGEALHDHNLSGITWFGSSNYGGVHVEKGEPRPAVEGGNYMRFKNWKDFTKAYIKVYRDSKLMMKALHEDNVHDFVYTLRAGGYFTADPATYLGGVKAGMHWYKGPSGSSIKSKKFDSGSSKSSKSSKKVAKKDDSGGVFDDEHLDLNYAGYRTKRMKYYYSKGFGSSSSDSSSDSKSKSKSSGKSGGSITSVTNSNHKELMKKAGIKESEMDAANYIINRESTWNVHAVNGQYYGLFQTTPERLRKYGSDWKDNPVTQLKAMNAYAKERYGSMNAAQKWWVSHGWW